MWLLLTLLQMAFIFFMSSRDGTASSADSSAVVLFLLRTFLPHFKEKTEAAQLLEAARFTWPVRKAAHMTEYALLAVFMQGTLRNRPSAEPASERTGAFIRKAAAAAWVLAVLYACTDELHQRAVPGRAGEFRDVCIDAAGAAIGLAVRAAAGSAKRSES